MSKSNLVDIIVTDHKLSKKEAENIISIFTNSVTSSLKQGKEVNLIGFGNFKVDSRAAREGHNPKTREKINIAAYNSPRFKAGSKLKEACNGK